MFLKKNVVCLFLLLVFSFVCSAAEMGEQQWLDSQRVDEIYAQIRHRGPVYSWEERTVAFANEGMTLVATLVLPKAAKKCPVILVLNGFAGDRKEIMITGTNEYLWERLSRMLAEQGLATLRIDFRGSGDSEGEYDMTTFSTQISDALAALMYIRVHLRWAVQRNAIGILGFSQGGLVGACAAARDHGVASLLLWSPVSHAPIVYENLLTKEGLFQGFALPASGSAVFPIYVGGQYVNWDVPLGKGFFEDLYRVDPVSEIHKNYKGPLMALCGTLDPIIWPQPHMSELYLRYHDGFEKMVVLEADHAFNWWDGSEPEKLHDAIYWSAAWFLYTLQ